jgi:hypothetical protein
MPDLKPEELKQLLTAAELKLVESSQPPTLAKLSEAKLKKQITLTRKARDKWRDQSTRQRREVQRAQGSRVTDAAVRSASKNEILTKALNDLQEQLDKIGSGTVAPGTKAPSPKGPSKEKRARGHRETRAEVRASLEEKRINLTGTSATAGATKKKVAKKVGKKPASIKGTVSKKKSVTKKAVTKKAVTKKAVTKKAVKKAPRKKATKKKAARKTTAEKMSSIGNPLTAGLSARLNLNPSDQQATKTKAKKARIRQAGLTTRTRGHISARGRRAQGRRDSRG